LTAEIDLPARLATVETSKRIKQSVREEIITEPQQLANCLAAHQPFVVRGYAADWPLVAAGKQSIADACQHILSFYEGVPCSVFRGRTPGQAHVFYDDDMALNFDSSFDDLEEILREIEAAVEADPQPLIYSGSIPTRKNLPGFEHRNGLTLGARKMMCSLWVGTKSRIPIHSDYLDNFACVTAGRRHVTLFPPEQFDNLYIGPLHYTPATRPVSLVDMAAPDWGRFEKFETALAAAQQVTLEPGDMLHIPSMWWHHIEGLCRFNILVNFWWNEQNPFLGSPEQAMWHAIWAIRDLSQDRRAFWHKMFDHYVFDARDEDFAHIADHRQGILKPLDSRAAAYIRDYLLREISK